MARIIVTGYMIRYPVGGNLLAFAYYLIGLRRLGHQVVYVEESGWPFSCFDPNSGNWQDDPAAGISIVQSMIAEAGLDETVVYVNAEKRIVHGTGWPELKEMLRSADLLLNVGGVCWLPEFDLCPRRAMVDMDPFFTQVGKFGGAIASNHHTHFTYGGNIGKPDCNVPTAGIDWIPTVPPVVVDHWTVESAGAGAPLTTIAHWNAYGSVKWQGETYGQKDVEFLRLIDVPAKTSQPIELAVSGAPRDIVDRFSESGWLIRDPAQDITKTLDSYRAYISRSKGEFSAAKSAYVKTRSGWFSDRTICYLACGLPAILQDTGFTDFFPVGEGILVFKTPEEAMTGIEDINRRYQAHCRAARSFADEFFDSGKVLRDLLNRAMN